MAKKRNQGIKWDRKGRQKKFKVKRDAQSKQVQEQIKIIESNPQLQKIYLNYLSSIKAHGKFYRRDAIKNAVRVTKEFAEENGIPWRQQE